MKKILKSFTLIVLLFISHNIFSQTVEWVEVPSATTASFRALSVVNDKVAWLGGSKGTVGFTSDGGKTWTFSTVPDFATVDFRSVYAFDEKNVIIANAGSPGYILKTTDGGQQWKVVYKNDHKDAFFDGTDFWNAKEGMVYGDPIDGRMLIVQTTDGGNTWKELAASSRPELKEGEASFAASNTGIRCLPKNKVVIATGGKTSRLWISEDKGMHWKASDAPIIQGEQMTGIYSVAFRDGKKGIIVGGDYNRDTLKTDHIFLTSDFGKTWKAPSVPTRGIRECVEYITDKVVIATGQRGSDFSVDGGVTWKMLSDEKYFDVVRKARKGSLIIIAGGKGKVGILKIKP